MSEIGGGRATNGGSRTGGPVPVSSSRIMPPTEIMRNRQAREAKRQEEQKLEEQKRVDEERRRSAQRRAAAAVPGAAPRFSQASSQYSPDVSAQQGPYGDRNSGQVAGSDAYGDPTSRSSQGYQSSRPRGPSVPQQGQPRAAAPATTGASRRTQPSQSAPRQPSSQGAAAGTDPQQRDSSGQRGASSSFPHAFERWETLSSHWEGLTSYWLHKLEQNTEDLKDGVPGAATMNRQVTDLSAAGANLFHAVVELQRLRASSERKFQRWFFDTRADTERNREIQGQLENQLKIERNARDESARGKAEGSIQVENAKREVSEMRRELMIAKDEARRAWEELGRRNQESLETAQSLKDGRVTLVGGVQVVPYFGGPSRTGSTSQRPGTREGQPQYGSTGMASAAGAAGLQSPGDEGRYYQEGSPTNTDPFTEDNPQEQPMQSESGKQSLAAGTYQPGYGDYRGIPTTTSSSTVQTAIPSSGQRPAPASAGSLGSSRVPVTAQEAQRFYQHAPQETFLHSAQSSPQAVGTAGIGQTAPATREEVRSEASYVDSLDEGAPEYAIDADGNVRRDDQGQPMLFRSRVHSNGEDDDYDTEADVRREQELAAQYGSGLGSGLVPEAPFVPSTSAQAMATYTPSSTSGAQSGRPDYEGSGYGSWDTLQTRHHHPTRLSDVLEEEEERSSRRTGE